MQNPLRRRNRALTVEQREEVQKLVYELVHGKLIDAFGPGGLWTVSMKDPTAIDQYFSQTVADTLAWKIAAQLAVPKKSRHQAVQAVTRTPEPVVVTVQTPALVDARLVA